MVQPVAGIFWDSREPHPRLWQRTSTSDPITVPIWHPEPESAPTASPRSVLPPLSSSVIAHVIHDTAKVSVTQLFQNITNHAIQKGAFTFPLPAGCTVIEFSCRIGTNRIVRAKIGPKLSARQAFNDAVDRNQTASLLEQDTPEVFKTTLGNIPANARLKTIISFVTVLKHKFADSNSTTTLTIPTYIAPRYGTPPTGFGHGATVGTSSSFTIQVEVVAAEEIGTISSTTHEIIVNMGVGTNTSETWGEFSTAAAVPAANRAAVGLANELSFLDRDFILDIVTLPDDGTEAPQACLEAHPLFEDHRALMLTIPSKFMLRNAVASHDAEIIFLADRSGSMEDKMQALISAMGFFLRGIPSGRKFNIWCFGSHHTCLWPRSEGYSDTSLRRALEYVSFNFRSDMGGTELLSALEAIIRTRDSNLMADVIILTDGQVWGLDVITKFVQQTKRSTEGRVRFFALGIGNAVSHELVEGIAKAGGGYAEVIPAAGGRGFEDRLLAMLRASLTGHVGPLRIDFEGVSNREAHNQGGESRETEGATGPSLSFMEHEAVHRNQGTEQSNQPIFLQSPADISTLSPFLRNRVYMLFSAASLPRLLFIKITANTPGGNEVVNRVEVKPPNINGSTLHKLGARALLGDLERGQSWIHLGPNAPDRGSPEEAERVRSEGEKLGCKWSLVSEWTSFYAAEELHEAEGAAPDPFLDVDDAQIRQVDGDLGLLRHRGTFGRQLGGAATADPARTTALSEEGSSEESGHDRDGDSQSDPWEGDHSNVDRDSERRDESGDEGEGASGGDNQGTGGGLDQQRSFGGRRSPALDAGPEGDSTFDGGNSESFMQRPSFPGVNTAFSPIDPVENPVSNVLYEAHRTLYSQSLLPQPSPQLLPRHSDKLSGPKNRVRLNACSLTVGPIKKALSQHGGYEASKGIHIYSPFTNLPASTSLLQTEKRDVLTAGEKDGVQIVRELLGFQTSDGSFQFSRLDKLDELDSLLGNSFVSFICNLVTIEVAVKSAVTAAIVALLEEKFQFCQDLWVMIVMKARDYLLHTTAPPDLLRSAKEQVKTVEIRLKSSSTNSGPYSLPPASSPTTVSTSSSLPTLSNPGTVNWPDSNIGVQPTRIGSPNPPPLSQSITKLSHQIDPKPVAGEGAQPTRARSSRQEGETSSTAESLSQPPKKKLPLGLSERRVLLDTAPVDDDDL